MPENGKGTIEDNDIFGNAHAGVEVRRAVIQLSGATGSTGNGYEAVWVYDGGGGTFEHNDLPDNARGARSISSDSQSKVTRASNRRT